MFISHVHAKPWFTDPLFAVPGQTVPRGHLLMELISTHSFGNTLYNRDWQSITTQNYKSTQVSPELTYGLTDNIDFQYTQLYLMNQSEATSWEHLGDTSLLLGFQVLSQDVKSSLPNLRITLEEVIPTGVYDNLSPANNGADITGLGSYQTTLGFNFDYISHVNEQHDIKYHLNLAYTHAASLSINGLSAFGGTSQTHGRMNPGDALSLDVAGELTLTQHWVGVMEANYIYQKASSFHGVLGAPNEDDPSPLGRIQALPRRHKLFPSRHDIGGMDIGNGNLDQITFAPALEYNLSENYKSLNNLDLKSQL